MSVVRLILGGAAGAAAVAAGVGLVPPGDRPAPDPGAATAVTPAADPPPSDTDARAAPRAGPGRIDDPAMAAGPRLDVARVEPDGAALFAGVAAPGARVEVRDGAQVVAKATADADGGFVAFGAVGGEAGARRLDLVAVTEAEDGATTEDAAAPVLVARGAQGDGEALVAQPTEDGLALLQPRALGADGGLSLDAVSYAADGALDVTGRGPRGGRVSVFADGRKIAEADVTDAGGWRARAEAPLAPGSYTLSVKLFDADGMALASVESPFVRETVSEALDKGAVVVAPGDSLWRVAQNVYGQGARYTVIYEANAASIPDPDLIYPGQVLALPPAD